MQLALEATSTEGLMQAAVKIQTIDVDREAEKVRLSTLLADITSRVENTCRNLSVQVGALEANVAAAPPWQWQLRRYLGPRLTCYSSSCP